MDTKIIQAVIDAGFTPYMRDTSDTYMHFTDGTRIGYLQKGRFGGVSVSTVHVPNKSTGTGFGIAQDESLSKELLESALIHAPHWASSFDRQSVKKYPTIAAFLAASRWNMDYKPVSLEA